MNFIKKKLAFVLLVLVAATTSIYAQKIVKNEKDEFTKASIVKTSYEVLKMGMKFTMYCGYSKIDENYYLNMKMMMGDGSVFSINKDDKLMFLMSDGEVLELYCPEFTLTCRGCGAKGFSGSAAQGIKIMYRISKDKLEQITKGKVSKVRIYTSEGYVEGKIKNGSFTKLKKGASLILKN